MNPVAILGLISNLYEQIAALQAENENLQPYAAGEGRGAGLPEGAVGWYLANGRRVYPAPDGSFVAADEGGWIDGTRPSVAAWLSSANPRGTVSDPAPSPPTGPTFVQNC